MITRFLIALCAAALFAVSCGEGEPIVPQEPEVPEVPEDTEMEKPVIDFNAEYNGLMLGHYDATHETWSLVDKMEAEIVGGSGDYKIIYPEEIFCKYWGDESEPMVPYSEDILKVWVEGDVIHVVPVLPAYNPSGEKLWIKASFILEDGKGQQKPFGVGTLVVWGGIE